jgi:hypothetical protein
LNVAGTQNDRGADASERSTTGSPPSRARRFGVAALRLATSLLISLFAVEIVLRLVFVAPRLIGSHYPHGAGIAGSELRLAQAEYDTVLRYNRFGFRGKELPLVKQPHELRVLVLGDSFAEGIGVAEQDRFADVLERDLAAREQRPVVVIDVGQMATGPAGYVRNLAEFGVALAPDVVVMAVYVGNDFSTKIGAPRAPLRIAETIPPHARTDDRSWTGIFRLAYLRRGIEQLVTGRTLLFRPPARLSPWEVGYGRPISRQYFVDTLSLFGAKPEQLDAVTARMDPQLVAEFYAGRLNPSYFLVAASELIARDQGKLPPPVTSDPDDDVQPVAELLANVDRTLAARGVRFLVLVIPDVHEMEPRAHSAFLARLGVGSSPQMRRTGALRRAFVRALAEHSIPTIDLTRPLRRSRERAFHVMDGHFNEVGHRIAAQALLDAITGDAATPRQ